MRRCSVVATLLFSSHAFADAPSAPNPAPNPAQSTTPAAAATAAPTATATPALTEATDPLQEARELVEVAPNTKENLKKAIAQYERHLDNPSLPARARADGWADTARAWQRLGDLETGEASKIDAYTRGRAAAKKGIAADSKHANALFWDMANLATTGRAKGVMNSLFMLPELRKGLARVLELNPNHLYARDTLGEIDHAVPGLAGGSDDRAEKAYLENLRRDPTFTPAMVLLARLYRDNDKEDAAKRWAQKVLSTKSSVPNDWAKFDKRDAQAILKELE